MKISDKESSDSSSRWVQWVHGHIVWLSLWSNLPLGLLTCELRTLE